MILPTCLNSAQLGATPSGSTELSPATIAAIAAAVWTSGEKAEIRDALGVTGAKTTATGGQLQLTRDQAVIAAVNTQK